MKKKYKRIGLYFNPDNIEEMEMYNYLEDRGKSNYIKRLIMFDIKSKGITVVAADSGSSDQVPDLEKINVDFEMEGMNFDD